MGFIAYDSATGGYWLENDLVKFRVKPSGMVDNFTILSLDRNMGYFYPWLNYWTQGGVNGSFYLHTMGDWDLELPYALYLADGTYLADGSILASGGSEDAMSPLVLVLTKTYTDANSVVHSFTMTITLVDGASTASIQVEDSTSEGLKQIQLNIEANLYPQGYAGQGSGGNFNAGGNATYTVPAPYDDALYSFFCKGLIKQDAVDLETVSVIDGYLAAYSADASIGLFTNFVDLNKVRVSTLSAGDERQYGWLDLLPRPRAENDFTVTFHVGAWAVGSVASCVAAYEALPYVEALEALPAAEYNKVVRTDLNASLYDYHEEYQELLGNITAEGGTATLVPAGTPSFKFYKHRAQGPTWNGTVQDIQEDFVLKSITMAREAGHRLFVEVDILDGTWNAADPTNKAIEADEVTQSVYWPKLHRLVTPGELYHDAFIAHATYLCQKYNFYGLALSECAFKHIDYSSEAKALFLADNPGYTDWPRLADGSIDVEDETLGKWKTDKLAPFWDELKAITTANNKKFFIMVEPNFWDLERQAWEYGQYWPEAIQHCDGLWVWGYYGVFGVHPFHLENVVDALNTLKALYPDSENIISIGLWAEAKGAISASKLNAGLLVLNSLDWPSTGQGIEVTPSKYMTADHWATLWGTGSVASRYTIKDSQMAGNYSREPAVSI